MPAPEVDDELRRRSIVTQLNGLSENQFEAALASAAKAGLHDAFAALIKAHYVSVYRFLMTLTRDSSDAADLTQETYQSAWKSLSQFNEQSSIKTWLHRIAYRKFLDTSRRCRHLPGSLLPSHDVDLIEDRLGPLASAIQSEQSHRLRAAVDQLDDDERMVVALHYFQGLTLREAGSVLGQPESTIKWRHRRALDRLSHLLDQSEVAS